MSYLKGAFEVVDLVPFDKCRKILLLQFGGVDDNNVPNYQKLIDIFNLETAPGDHHKEQRKLKEQEQLMQFIETLNS